MTSFADLERRSAQPLGVPHDTSVPTRSGDCGCGGGGGGSDECGCAGTCDLHGSEAGLERTRYYPRQIVTSDRLEVLARHRYIHYDDWSREPFDGVSLGWRPGRAHSRPG